MLVCAVHRIHRTLLMPKEALCILTEQKGRKRMISRRAMVAVSMLAVAAGRSGTAKAALTPDLAASGGKLKALAERVSKVSRRRDFKSAPMILTEDNQWDHAIAASLGGRRAIKAVSQGQCLVPWILA
jgi:hypothetical protein